MTETRLDIDIRNLNCFTKDKCHILKNVGFQAKAGEFYAILGPSGSGKSTLLNFIGNQAKGKLNFCADQFKVNSQDVQ
jgi:ABC-type lipoprotein export system ATPase subunit